jgi:hypothetical protein
MRTAPAAQRQQTSGRDERARTNATGRRAFRLGHVFEQGKKIGSMNLATNKRRFRCPVCERMIERQSRTQVYCSPKCMRKGNYAKKAGLGLLSGQDTAVVPTPHKSSNENNVLQWPKSRSSSAEKALRTDGVIGPRRVIDTECIAGRNWQKVISSGGVVSWVSRLTARVLREG